METPVDAVGLKNANMRRNSFCRIAKKNIRLDKYDAPIAIGDPEMMGSVHLEVMCPYDLSVDGENAAFMGVLNDYNSAIPWAEKESILLHYAEIDEAVAGDVDRLRRWLVRAVNHALADEEATGVHWHDLVQTKPLSGQRLLAQKERRTAISFPIVRSRASATA